MCAFLSALLPDTQVLKWVQIANTGHLQQSLWTVGGHGGVSQKEYPEKTSSWSSRLTCSGR